MLASASVQGRACVDGCFAISVYVAGMGVGLTILSDELQTTYINTCVQQATQGKSLHLAVYRGVASSRRANEKARLGGNRRNVTRDLGLWPALMPSKAS